MEKSGVYSPKEIKVLRQYEFYNDFYLEHAMKETEYSEGWRIYFPKSLK
jgi:hypothetical protein